MGIKKISAHSDIEQAPDKHLLKLWTTREQLHDQYLQKGKTHADLVRVRHKTAQIRRHSKHLGRQRWEEQCASFGKDTGLRKLWGTYQALRDKKKTRGVVETVLLTQGMSHEEFEEEAANIFFPQPTRNPPASIYEPEPVDETNELETPFTPAELHTALEQVRVQSAPGKDGITWTMLRNLSAQEKDTLLDTVNEIWVSGQLPPWMKHAVVAPIPKAGKRSNEVPNLRPVSLTSTICKLLERLCLNRLNHHLEEVSFFFHPHQTGFRPNLSTQDSIYLLRRLLSTKRGRRRTVPSILVAVDLKKAFDSVTHEAVIRDLKEAYPGKRMLNIVKSFLCNRTFEVRSGRDEPKQFSSCVGVPQGAILSPLLFNVAMTGVTRKLELIHGVRFTLGTVSIMFSKVVLCCLFAYVASQVVVEHPPQPYSFGYDTTDAFGTRQTRQETSDEFNNKIGSYSFVDAKGIARAVNYVADGAGFRVRVDTNEPGTKTSAPANAEIVSSAAEGPSPVVVSAVHAAPVAVRAVHAAPFGYAGHAAPVVYSQNVAPAPYALAHSPLAYGYARSY
ncbi:hypothetical protein ISCGN_017347 [Ixodes scapularis]